jgi:hypothetical protein
LGWQLDYFRNRVKVIHPDWSKNDELMFQAAIPEVIGHGIIATRKPGPSSGIPYVDAPASRQGAPAANKQDKSDNRDKSLFFKLHCVARGSRGLLGFS